MNPSGRRFPFFRHNAARLLVAPLVLFLGLVAPGPGRWVARASGRLTHTGNHTLENWQLEQGLPQISVTSIAQTHDGYLWLGTFNGLARFDGVRFTVFNARNTPDLGDSGILQLQVDEMGTLWIVTQRGGLVRMSAGRFRSVSRNNVRLLLGGVEFSAEFSGSLLVLDAQDRWHRIADEQLVPVENADRLNADDSFCFRFDGSGGAWVTEHGRVDRVDQRRFSALTDEAPNPSRIELRIQSVARSRHGGDWLATDDGIYRLHQGRLSSRVAEVPLGVTLPVVMKEDGQAALWIGKWGHGVYRLNPSGDWQHFGAGSGLYDSYVNCLFRDREGSLWVGTGQGGLHRFRPRIFQVWDTEQGTANNVVTSVTQDPQGRMWLGINGAGLHTWVTDKLRPVSVPSLLRKYPLTYSVLADRQEAVWVGLYGMTALRWHADTITTYRLGEGQAMTPHAWFEDRSGTIWLGCTHGLLRHEKGQFTRHPAPDGLASDKVVALAEDPAGTLYVGTDGGGLKCLHQGRVTCYTERDGLGDNHVAAVCVDTEGTVWIGTANGGLSRFRHNGFATLTMKDGLPTDTIGTLLDDGLGNLWLGSNRGIICLNRTNLNDYLDGRGGPAAWRVFGLADGLSTLGCTGVSQPASCKAQDGTLWFSTTKGVAVVDPSHLPFNPFPPPVVIEEVVADDRLQIVGDGGMPFEASTPAVNGSSARQSQSNVPTLVLPSCTHRIEFRFTGLSLLAPEKVRFRYRLDPFDGEWVEAGTRRNAVYTGIRPGRYQLRVTACNNDGVWNKTGAALGLVVAPPWWMTWWSRVLMGIGVAGLGLSWYERRLLRLQHERIQQQGFARRLIASQEDERRRLAGELHDGMGQDLLVIAGQAQLSLRQQDNSATTTARLREIADTARRAVQQVRHMAYNLRPGLLDELGLTKAVRATLDKAAQASGLSIAADLADVDGLLPPEFEVNLYRIAQETLNNVIKHAAASKVKVALTRESTGLRLVVEDNGCGFEPSHLELSPPGQRGFGLHQIAGRAKMMGGHLDLRSRPGEGTRLTVDLPLSGRNSGASG
jgi:signal transduction histidine kinase/ligand-binding sensor domain-containing protein